MKKTTLPDAFNQLEWVDEILWLIQKALTKQLKWWKVLEQVVQFKYEGGWPKKKNWALENLPFTNEWVLILDADECLPPNAQNEIRGIVSNRHEKHSGYWINRRYFFLGKPLKHAYFPNWNLRLFKHKLGRYEKITDL